jgi:hypothetical protein
VITLCSFLFVFDSTGVWTQGFTLHCSLWLVLSRDLVCHHSISDYGSYEAGAQHIPTIVIWIYTCHFWHVCLCLLVTVILVWLFVYLSMYACRNTYYCPFYCARWPMKYCHILKCFSNSFKKMSFRAGFDGTYL